MLALAKVVAARTLLLIALAACNPLIAPYSEQAYRNATSLKARSLILMAQSDAPFSAHATDAQLLVTDMAAAYEYARGLPNNQVTAEQWQILRDPNGKLLGGFIAKWEAEGTVAPFVAGETADLVAFAFDRIICLEVNKSKPSTCKTVPGGPDA